MSAGFVGFSNIGSARRGELARLVVGNIESWWCEERDGVDGVGGLGGGSGGRENVKKVGFGDQMWRTGWTGWEEVEEVKRISSRRSWGSDVDDGVTESWWCEQRGGVGGLGGGSGGRENVKEVGLGGQMWMAACTERMDVEKEE
ncbi:hypothetical protein R1sor_006581 [Riccia sorocarpa]|uniref:Uncharacterized protein n=1 Tax=Riccia sorocarpa TaxID=122646 RepID=A0ABD3HS64_9MARC